MTRSDMIFIVEMSVRYHRRRAAFLERLGMFLNLVNLVGGAGAFLSLIGSGSTIVAQVATLFIAIISVIQAVYRIDTAAADNRQWLAEWLDILTDIHAHPNASAEQVTRWIERRHQIESRCVCELRALQVDCQNKTVDALKRNGTHVPIRWWHKAFMQVYSFETAFN